MPKIKTSVLIATSFNYIEHLKYKESEKYLLGDWCLQNASNVNIGNDTYFIQKHHWVDSQKYDKDFAYLDSLNERLLLPLSNLLNKYHNVNYSVKYWRIVLGPWLLTFVPTVYDRWETLRVALDSKRLWEYDLFVFDDNKFIPNNFSYYQTQANSHIWNSFIFSQILTFQYSDKVNFNRIEYEGKYPLDTIKETKYSFKYKVINCIDSLLSLLKVNYKVIFVGSYFDFFSLIKLSLKLNQIPRIHSVFTKNISFKKYISNKGRALNLDKFHSENDFEEFVQGMLFSHIPKSYLEGYLQMEHEISKVRCKGSIVFTANAHLSNDFFNHWCAKMIESGVLLVTSQHGSAFRQSKSLFLHQEKISDKMTVWHHPVESNHVRLSASKLVNSNRNYVDSGDELSVVAFEQQIYVYRAQTGSGAGTLIADYNQKIDFIRKLAENPFQNVKVRAVNRGEGWFNSLSRYKKDLGRDKISNYNSFEEMLSNSKIVVCTYPLTTYLEAMLSGIPTIVLYKKEQWRFSPIFDKLIKTLESNNMIFYDSNSAANHINSVWSNPLEWWDSDSVLKARQMFFDVCGDVDDDWADEWSSFFRNL